MASCPACKKDWPDDVTMCPICGRDLANESDTAASESEENWLMIGSIPDKVTADFARETLAAYEIPAVVVSKSGYFGQIGLTLTSFYTGRAEQFEVSVPETHREEASELLAATLGDKWQPAES